MNSKELILERERYNQSCQEIKKPQTIKSEAFLWVMDLLLRATKSWSIFQEQNQWHISSQTPCQLSWGL